MRWTVEPKHKVKDGDTRMRWRFALWPTRMGPLDGSGTTMVWLEVYRVKQTYDVGENHSGWYSHFREAGGFG